ncbi:SPOR domain-containing protein [Croceibacterium soli]|uniref:SPOR domain-containing protein n=1 Tax=Croceibacterium soli TaxID=1739690 RepID=UPI001F37C922|nr:SPOR domain-containing protein [Croceibacterium soli]
MAGVAACAVIAVLAGGLSSPAAAQGASRAVVQSIPPADLANLNGALRDLARNPNDVFALIRAGRAAIGLNDTEAALGYFRRAEAIAPADGRVKAGLASVMVRTGDPLTAVQLFAQAEASGAPMAEYAADRGLAHDLLGENARAQQLYRQALARANDPEVVRRLALSQAIMGDQRGSEASLLPLLQRQDLAAYRTRAFALAILGKSEEAVSIAETMLPDRLSNRMAPYLRYMPRLTRAQQAAAAHLGRFPRASEIGRDNAQIAAYAGAAAPAQAAAGSSDSRLIPTGEPLGAARPAVQSAAAAPPPQRQPVVVAAAVPQRVAAAAPPPVEAQPQFQLQAQPQPQPQPQPQAQPVLVASLAAPAPATAPSAPPVEEPRPSLSVAAPAAEPAEPEVSLSEAFAAFTLVPDAPPPAARGAVDITAIKPPREKPKVEEPTSEKPKAEAPKPKPKAEPPKPPAHPSRFWVQVATGRDLAALAFDWRRIKRTAGDLLAKREPFTADWGKTNRLVTGPYANAAEAQKAVSALKEKGLDSFTFTSAAGEEVVPLK